MKNKCLYCYKEVDKGNDFHDKCSKQFFGTTSPPKIDYTYSQMSELAKKVVERSVSVPGVQSKLSMSVIKEKTISRLTVVGALGGNYIFKPPSDEFNSMPENEHLTMHLAELFGIKTVSSSLIKLKSGELSYITKRIDRTDKGEKIHMIDMFQILEAYDKYKSSMEKVGKAVGKYSSNTLLDKVSLFELAIFCFLIGNNDMHLKNFSMINTIDGWVIAPFYDLLNVRLVIKEDKDESALSINGKKRKFTKKDFDDLGENLGLSKKQIDSVYLALINGIQKGVELIKRSFISKEMQNEYIDLLRSRCERLDIVLLENLNKQNFKDVALLHSFLVQEMNNQDIVFGKKYLKEQQYAFSLISKSKRKESIQKKIAGKRFQYDDLIGMNKFDEQHVLWIEINRLNFLLKNYRAIPPKVIDEFQCFHLPQTVQNIDRINKLYNTIKGTLITSDTTLPMFKSIFNNAVKNKKVDWKVGSGQFFYFINKISEITAITTKNKWIRASACFTIKGEDIDPNVICNSKDPKDIDKVKAVDEAVAIFLVKI